MKRREEHHLSCLKEQWNKFTHTVKIYGENHKIQQYFHVLDVLTLDLVSQFNTLYAIVI